ncbi:glycosyltransferase [Oryzomonas rubra]|uniref:Glycosyltransferase n=1 Tax=Oryzomonas rubra TaxID=2509454 RepID=A0A5A9XJH3_9BACT|nr:glycosyltransferase [Oryzomonas rubra]KAA0893322.1 glycosyltransferase [Oryzomonas rubra]
MKLSVLMITYNHEKYIAQALDSILMQKVNFDYEIVIGEDCSTDNTRSILLEYHEKYPGKIRLLLPEKNLGMTNNFVTTFKSCTGDYIALLEGDDYWTSSDKLQDQVDFLDAHPSCAICFHNSEEFYDDGTKPSWNYCADNQQEISSLKDLLLYCNFIPTCSALFRNRLFEDFPDWYYTLGMGDWTLHILNAQHGDIGYINRVLGRHRHHVGGVWSLRNQVRNILDVINAYNVVDEYLNHVYTSIVNDKISIYYYQLAQIQGDISLVDGIKYLYISFVKSNCRIKMLSKLFYFSARMVTRRLAKITSKNSQFD